MQTKRSEELLERARAVIPGGVNSPVRAFKSVGGTPRFLARGEGARVWDVDGNEYVDYIGSWGPMILGHAHPEVLAAARAAVDMSSSFGAPTELEVQMAEHVTKRVPSVERLRLVSSGTEAAMSAIRVARAATQRDKIIKFVGCYHGHADYLLVQAGSGVATLGLPDSPGVPASFTEHTLALPFNDLGAVERAFGEYPDQIAAVALEAVTGNMGVMAPKPGYLEGLRELTTKHGAMLMFDEVMTGFRVHEAGAQGLFGIEPDITAFGKVIGGGFPMAGFGGKAAAMDLLAPVGPVYQAGTLSGNPAAVAAGLTTLELLDAEAYAHLETLGAALQAGLEEALSSSKQSGRVQRIGSMITLYFNDGSPLHDFDDAKAADHQKFAKFFHGMLDRGFHLPPSGYESWFLSTAHSKADIDATVAAAAEVMNTL